MILDDRKAARAEKRLKKRNIMFRVIGVDSNTDGMMTFQCQEGHLFEENIKRILYKNKGCPDCNYVHYEKLADDHDFEISEWCGRDARSHKIRCKRCGRYYRMGAEKLKRFMCNCDSSKVARYHRYLWENHELVCTNKYPFATMSTNRRWRCRNWHVFFASLDQILRRRHKCLDCWNIERRDEMNKYLIRKDIVCRSAQHSSKVKLEFECLNCERMFKARAGRSVSCPYCSQPKPVQQCWRIFELLLGKPFIKSRPDWLINPETGYRLELDGYCKELGVAYEFQGRQHYQTVKFLDGFSDVEKQKKRDELKHEICKQKGVDLIRVSYGSYEDMLTEIYKSLTELGYIQVDGNRNI